MEASSKWTGMWSGILSSSLLVEDKYDFNFSKRYTQYNNIQSLDNTNKLWIDKKTRKEKEKEGKGPVYECSEVPILTNEDPTIRQEKRFLCVSCDEIYRGKWLMRGESFRYYDLIDFVSR